ncbi:hypothetical protein ACFQZ0_12125 [Streptomyces erythrogriseus]|uniref:hypothetical protein n=1 Tax=Streptomyces erythrogriseus TaxID=284027 RepID=UPI0031F7D3C3
MSGPPQPSWYQLTQPATAVTAAPTARSGRPRSTTPVASPSSGKNSSQSPPWATASAQVTAASRPSATRRAAASRRPQGCVVNAR